MLAFKRELYTHEEYLALEEAADNKNEYYRGEIFAMSGATKNHNRIALNMATVLNTQLENTPCEAFIGDIRVLVEAHDLYTYPDVVVACGEPRFDIGRDDTIINPRVIIEVLSNSTKRYDKGDKFRFYKALPSFEEYILIDQSCLYIQQYSKQANGEWALQAELEDLADTLTFQTIGCTMPVAQIYRRVVWERRKGKVAPTV